MNKHDLFAPYWAAGLVVLCVTGVSTTWIDLGSFWKGYVLDMTGPAWTYILIRLLYTSQKDNAWTRFFTPSKTIAFCLAATFSIEGIQYMGWYDSTFDLWDLLAYGSILIPVYILDMSNQ